MSTLFAQLKYIIHIDFMNEIRSRMQRKILPDVGNTGSVVSHHMHSGIQYCCVEATLGLLRSYLEVEFVELHPFDEISHGFRGESRHVGITQFPDRSRSDI